MLPGRDEEKATVAMQMQKQIRRNMVHERRSTPEVRRYRRIIVICTRSRCTPAQSPPFVPLFNIIRNDPQSLEAGRYIGQNHLHVRSRVPNACQQRAPACLSFVSIYVVGHGALVSILAPVLLATRFAPNASLQPITRRCSGHEVDQSHGQPGFSPGTARFVRDFRLCDTLP